MAYLVPPNVILKYFQNFWSCCEAPVLPILHFLVSNESLEHYLNAILQKFCSRDYQFLKTKPNVSKFMILLSKISDLPPKCNLKYFRKFWSCWWTIMSFTIIGWDVHWFVLFTQSNKSTFLTWILTGKIKWISS